MVSAYQRVYSILKRKLMDNEIKLGELLPAEPALCNMFGVSRTTVRKAIEMLVMEGFVRVQQGRGTVVIANKRTRQHLNLVTSLVDTFTEQGMIVTYAHIDCHVEEADHELAKELQILEGSSVAVLDRVLLADNVPTCILKNSIAYNRVPGIEKRLDKFHEFYSFLEEYYGIYIDSAVDCIVARNASLEQAKILGVAEGAAVLVADRITSYNNKPVSKDFSIMRGDRYELFVASHGRK